MLKKLDKKDYIEPTSFESNEGERSFLSSDKNGIRSPSLDFLDTSAETVSEEMILNYLAQIISEVYMYEVHGINPTTTKESSNLLQGFNKRTS